MSCRFLFADEENQSPKNQPIKPPNPYKTNRMTSKTLFGKLALAGCSLIAATTIGRAQVTITDIGPALPTPGTYDVYQFLFQAGNPQPGPLNYYTDAGTRVGSTFVTPSANPGGYVLNSVTLKTAGGASTGGGPTTSQTYNLRIYSVSGTTATLVGNYTSQAFTFSEFSWLQITNFSLPVSANATYAYTIHRNTSGWEQLGWTNGLVGTTSRACQVPTGGGNVTFATDATTSGTFDIGLALPTSFQVGSPTASAANPVLFGTAVTLTCGTVVDNVGSGTYSYQWLTDGGGGGALTNIPGATYNTNIFSTALIAQTNLGNYTFAVKVTDSTSQSLTSSVYTVGVFLREFGTIGTTPASVLPTPGADDAYQLIDEGNGNGTGSHPQGNLNYYTDNGQNNGGWMGNTFTTGSNPKGYTMGSLAVCMDGQGGADGNPNYGYGSVIKTATNGTYNLYIYKVSADLSTATVLLQVTNYSPGFVISNYPVWAISSFQPLTLLPNTTYGYGFGRGSVNVGYMEIALSTGDLYAGGTAASFPTAGGGITYINNGLDGVFDVGLDPLGFPFLLYAPVATPNPAYALSPVKLAAAAKTPGTYTFQWLTDDGSGSIPPNYIVMTGATGANVTVTPEDVNAGGSDYTTNYYFVATRTLDNISVTSPPVVLNVHAASPPVLTDPTPASLVTFAGANVTYVAGESGTLPITNQWFANYGGGYVPLNLKTNSTLVLTNVQTTDSGSYKMLATNLYGAANFAATTPVALTVYADPAAPNPATQVYVNMVYTNNAWAYWRLNETVNPASTTVTAYDYSGHGFFSTYGSSVTVNNAGPVPSVSPPSFPGFDPLEFAAGTTISTVGSSLTVPSLNLNGKSNVTFMAWINPNGTQAPNAGLLFNRGGPDSACGFGFGNTAGHLGYTWNNNAAATYNWDSGLVPAIGQWNFVAYVITPTNTRVYMGNLSGGTTNFYQSANAVANTPETFAGGTILLGGDFSTINRNFNGLICEAALFTNALTTLQVQQYFQTAIGATSLRPTVSALTVAPAAATGAGVYSGQNVRMTAINASGTEPLSYQWQTSPDGSAWANVNGETTSSLLVNPQTTGAFHYQLVVTNVAAAVTSSPVVVTFNALPSSPAGLWTVNFQPTNNIGAGQNVGGGVGHYVGRGILGNGTYWNILPHVLPTGGGYNGGNIASVSDLQDDGATHTGIYCNMYSGGSYNALNGGSLTYSSDVGNILDQLYRPYNYGNALQFVGVPSGIYNLVCIAGNGVSINGCQDYGSFFVVHDLVNGDQTNSTSSPSPVTDALSQGVNFVVFTNVYVTNGVLNVDVNPNTNANSTASAVIQAAQLQLVSYAVAPAPVRVTGRYVVTNKNLTVTWPQGILQTATNLVGPWTPIYAPSPVTVTATNGTQFFRTQVHP